MCVLRFDSWRSTNGSGRSVSTTERHGASPQTPECRPSGNRARNTGQAPFLYSTLLQTQPMRRFQFMFFLIPHWLTDEITSFLHTANLYEIFRHKSHATSTYPFIHTTHNFIPSFLPNIDNMEINKKDQITKKNEEEERRMRKKIKEQERRMKKKWVMVYVVNICSWYDNKEALSIELSHRIVWYVDLAKCRDLDGNSLSIM